MAKIKGPLFSFEGTGKVGKKLIYRERKKIKDTKKYVVPYNPKTDDQEEKRGYMRTAVSGWKTDGYTKIDIEAWKLYAKTQKKTISGFNAFVGLKINADKEGKKWTKLTKCIIEVYSHDFTQVNIDIESEQIGLLYYGTSKENMREISEAGWYPNYYMFYIFNLIPGTKYYLYIANTAVGEAARTGIYTFKNLKE